MKNAKHIFSVLCLSLMLCGLLSGYVHAHFSIGIMQSKKGCAVKFRPFLNYFAKNDIDVSFIAARSYPHAAKMFSSGEIDGIFSSSGIAGCMIIKELAYPLVRPVNIKGGNTRWAVVLAPKGSPRFTQNANYFQNKKVIFCGLATSGEFFYRSIIGKTNCNSTIMKASSHGAAIDTLSRGIAEVAIVKNQVWEKMKADYPNIERVGEGPVKSPNGTLIIAKGTDPEIVDKITSIMLGLEMDNSAEAKLVKKKMRLTGYIKVGVDDFKSTIELLKKAGVDKSFDFAF